MQCIDCCLYAKKPSQGIDPIISKIYTMSITQVMYGNHRQNVEFKNVISEK